MVWGVMRRDIDRNNADVHATAQPHLGQEYHQDGIGIVA